MELHPIPCPTEPGYWWYHCWRRVFPHDTRGGDFQPFEREPVWMVMDVIADPADSAKFLARSHGGDFMRADYFGPGWYGPMIDTPLAMKPNDPSL